MGLVSIDRWMYSFVASRPTVPVCLCDGRRLVGRRAVNGGGMEERGGGGAPCTGGLLIGVTGLIDDNQSDKPYVQPWCAVHRRQANIESSEVWGTSYII